MPLLDGKDMGVRPTQLTDIRSRSSMTLLPRIRTCNGDVYAFMRFAREFVNFRGQAKGGKGFFCGYGDVLE